ncbi:hypothetical protein [Tranquillimonas rosea]|nr:hypothetical protein [Tranquillimonas rosea]
MPDFTGAFLVSFGVLLFVLLFAIWAVWGLLAALGVGWAGERLIGRSR